jgi:prepilin-type N-terminal cleavage/methylation domain-containing protein
MAVPAMAVPLLPPGDEMHALTLFRARARESTMTPARTRGRGWGGQARSCPAVAGQGVGAALGFSLIELVLTVAVFATMAAIALPVYHDLTDSLRLTDALRGVERELQAARLKAVTVNRSLRVRFNCPAAGQYRTVEVLGTAMDTAATRCDPAAFPYPAPDQNPFTRPNADGPLRRLPSDVTVNTVEIEFRPNGTAYQVVSGVPQAIAGTVSVTVTRRGQSRMVTINGLGKVELQ